MCNSETYEQTKERLLNEWECESGDHAEMYEKYKKEIWDLRFAAIMWAKQEISDSRFREIIGLNLLKAGRL